MMEMEIESKNGHALHRSSDFPKDKDKVVGSSDAESMKEAPDLGIRSYYKSKLEELNLVVREAS